MIVVKDMEMPEHCGYCRFKYDGLCHAARQSFLEHTKVNGKLPDCPLIEVPDPESKNDCK